MNQTAPWLIAAVAALSGIVATVALSRWWRSRRQRRRFERGAAAEREAAKLLRRAGYAIEAVQPEAEGWVRVDRRRHPFRVRADLLVRRGRRRFVTEVKSGAVAPDPSSPATRRQLFEYATVFGVPSVLLVDMEARRLHEVHFPAPFRWRAPAALLVGILAGLAAEWRWGLLAAWLG